MKIKILMMLAFLAVSSGLGAEPSWFLIIHTPGSAWDSTLEYNQQAGIAAHQDYLSTLAEQGSLAMAGGFADQSGGLLLLKQVSLESAKEIVQGDPMIRSGVLTAEIKAWQPEISTMTTPRKRKQTPSIPKGASFKIGSPNPQAPINLDKN